MRFSNAVTDISEIKYSVPEEWYDGLYRDEAPCCSAARSFSLVHGDGRSALPPYGKSGLDWKNSPDEKNGSYGKSGLDEKNGSADECYLVIHGYRGYPGEFVRPALDLYDMGYDVFVPRLPGHGTSWRDFIRSGGYDWTQVPANALADLKTRYSRVHIVSHSMGTAIAVNLAWKDSQVGKIVLACPSFTNLQMPLRARIILRLAGIFTPRLNCHWHHSTKLHLHYENAPCDDEFLGREYWTWYFTHKLFDYWHIMMQARKTLAGSTRTEAGVPHDHLVLCPSLDKIISIPSADIFRHIVGPSNANIVNIPDGTHSLFYDKSPAAEDAAVRAICEYTRGTPPASSSRNTLNNNKH